MTILKFTRRSSPVLPEHRPIYKISQILLILKFSRANKSSLLRLHLFNWIMKSEQRMNFLRETAINGKLSLPTWGFDPALAIALRFALADDLVSQISNGYQLQKKGSNFIDAAMKDAEIFHFERIFLGEIGKVVTEKMVETVAKDWN